MSKSIREWICGSKRYAIAAVIILLIEVFLWNHSFWLSLGQEPIVINEVYTRTGKLLTLGDDFNLKSKSYLEIRDINQEVKNIYLNIETYKGEQWDILTIQFQMTDAGKKNYYYVPERVISSRLQKLNYISLYPYGELKSLKIEFPKDEDITIKVKDIVLNPRVPMFFSVWRVVLMYLIYLVGTALFFRPYQSYYESGSKRQRLAAVGLCILSIAIVLPLTLKGDDANGRATMDKYKDLTHALAQGMVSVDIDVDERMFEAENPYDSTELIDLGLDGYNWDYAYFEGKFYVYFGVVPVVLTYLPCYLLTGHNLPHIIPYLFFIMMLIVGAFLLMDAMINKYCKKLPVKLYYLFLVTFMLGIGTLIFAKRVCIYNMAIMTGVCFTVWGLYFWISSVKESGQSIIWRVFLGSCAMALVAGCRPQLLMGSFLAFSIFGEKLKQIFADFKNKKEIKAHMLFIGAFCIPFIIVASLLMWYNYARFGSSFDFGAKYTLTTNDMRYRGFHVARFLSGLWSFLFKIPPLDVEFPYLGTTWVDTVYQGIITQEKGIGGIFATNLILWPCFFMYRYRAKLRDNKTLLFAVISIVSGIIISCVNVQAAGVIVRYMVDFTIFFYLASFMVIFSFISGYYKQQSDCHGILSEKVWCRGLAVLCCVTILYCFMTILMLYISGDYDLYRPVWYYHLKEIFGVLDI